MIYVYRKIYQHSIRITITLYFGYTYPVLCGYDRYGPIISDKYRISYVYVSRIFGYSRYVYGFFGYGCIRISNIRKYRFSPCANCQKPCKTFLLKDHHHQLFSLLSRFFISSLNDKGGLETIEDCGLEIVEVGGLEKVEVGGLETV